MKHIINKLLIMVFSCIALASCIKEEDNPSEGRLAEFVPVDILKRVYKDADVMLTKENMDGATSINGVVVSDAASKNIAPGRIAVQNFGRGTVRGILLEMESGTISDLAPGDSVNIAITGKTLAKVDGSYVLKGIRTADIKKIASNVLVTPIPVTIGTLASSFANYEGTLVRFTGELKNTPLPGETMKGNKQLIVGVNTGIYLSTLPDAKFADSLLPAKAIITGVPMMMKTDTGNVYIISPRTFKDIEAIKNVVLTAWQFGNPASTGLEASYKATTVVSNLDTAVLVRGAAYFATGLVRGFSSNTTGAWVVSKEDATNRGGYLEFKINARPGYSLSFDIIQARIRRSAAGANKYRWNYSLNNGTFKEIGTDDINFTSTADGVDQAPIALGGIADLKNVRSGTIVTFRLYAWGFSSDGGTLAVGRYGAGDQTNSLSVSGIIERE